MQTATVVETPITREGARIEPNATIVYSCTSRSAGIPMPPAMTADGRVSKYADEIADYFDSRTARATRAIMQSNRAPFLS
jgi:hypothetical protein